MSNIVRTRRKQQRYQQSRARTTNDACEFCLFSRSYPGTKIIAETPYFWITANMFPYDFWDSMGVTEHLMLVPKAHRTSLDQFEPNELIAYTHLLRDYEAQGYTIYLRAPASASRSVAHHHTHLIKLDNKPKKYVLFLRKPHMLLFR